MQGLIVALVVIACTVYAVWTLMPGAARRSLAGSMLKVALLNGRRSRRRSGGQSGHQNGSEGRLTLKLRKAAQATSGCACDGCDRAPKTAPQTPLMSGGDNAKVITFHPRVRR